MKHHHYSAGKITADAMDFKTLLLKENAIDEIQELMQKDPQVVNELSLYNGAPLLRLACGYNLDAAMFLLENSKELDVNKGGATGTSALSGLCFNKEPDNANRILKVAKALLSKGANIKQTNRIGETPLMEAASQGLGDFVLLLLQHDKDKVTVNITANSGRTALFYGVLADKIPAVKHLLSFRASLEMTDVQWNSVFHVVQSAECATLLWNELVASRQPVNASRSYDTVPLNIEVSEESSETASVIEELSKHFLANLNKYGLSPLSKSTLYRNDDLSRFFIRKWISVRLRDEGRNSALHIVCGTFSKGLLSSGDQELFVGWLDILFNDEKCEVNQKNAEGLTPLHLIANNSTSTEVFLSTLIRFDSQVWPNYHTQKAIIQTVTESNVIIKENPITCFFLVLWSSFDVWGPEETSKNIRRLSNTFEETVYNASLFSKSPLLLLIQAACAMEHHSKNQQECEREFNEIRGRLIGLITDTLDNLENNDLKSTLLILGGKQDDPFAFMKQGPLYWALRYGQEEFLSDPRAIEATNYVAGSSRLKQALVSPSLDWAKIWNETDAWEFSMYRRLPVLRSFVSFVFHCVLLLLTYGEILKEDSESWILRAALYGYIVGYTINEIHQIEVQEDYFGEVWNWLDLLILVLYISWVIINILCPSLVGSKGKAILTLNSFLVLFRTLHFSAFHKGTAVLVDSLFAMLRNVVEFLVIFLLFLFGFAVIFTVLCDDAEGFENLQATWLTLFSANLGNFDLNVFDESIRPLGISVMIIFLVVSSLVLMNMLIAIMSETFSRASEKRNERANRLFADFVFEFWHDESEMEWLPAPLCLMNPSIVFFTFFGYQSVSDFIIKLMDFIVSVIIVVPFCSCIRTITVVTVRWIPKGQTTITSSLRILWCALLTPLFFTIWFILQGVSHWKIRFPGLDDFSGILLHLLNPIPHPKEEKYEFEVDGYWISEDEHAFVSIVMDSRSGWGEGVIANHDQDIYNIVIKEIPQTINTYEIIIPNWGQSYTICLSEQNKIQNFPAWATSGNWQKQTDEMECIPRMQKILGGVEGNTSVDHERIQTVISNHCKQLEKQTQDVGMLNTAYNLCEDLANDKTQTESLRKILRERIAIRTVENLVNDKHRQKV